MDKNDQRQISFLIPSLAVGGAELQLITQLRLLAERDYSVSLIVLGNQLDLLSRVSLPEGRMLILGNSFQNHLCARGIFYGLRSAFSVYRFLKKNGIKRIIAILPMAHWVGRWTVFIGRFFFFGIRLCNYHKSQQFKANPPDKLVKKLFHRFSSVLAWFTDKANLFISQSVLNDISYNQFVRRPVILYNFVIETQPDEQAALQYLQQQGMGFRKLLVIPGRVHPVKGQVFFLESTASLFTSQRMEEEDILLVLAGGGPDEMNVREKCLELGISKHVLVTGFIEHMLLLALVKLADLIIIPSCFEGLGNVAIEALMLRKPVISSDAGGLTEIVKDSGCGVTFRAGNTPDLLHTMQRYLANELQFDTQAGFNWYMAHFTSQVHIERLNRFIEKL